MRPATDPGEPVELWVGGYLRGESPPVQIVFRRSLDGGVTWLPAGGFDDNDVGGGLRDLAIGQDGTAYTVGRTRRGASYAWLTRRSSNAGSNWEVVDDVGNNFGGFGVTVDDLGRAIATGGRWATSSLTVVRLSSTGAAGTWQDTDSFGASTAGALASAVAIDPLGNAYVFGGATDPVVLGKGWIRKLTALVRPKLTFHRSGSFFTISWPTNAIDFALQSATTLSAGGDWTYVDKIPELIDGQNKVEVESTGPAAFFRLRQP